MLGVKLGQVKKLINKTLTLGFQSSFGTNGYVKFPSFLGGLIIQWGHSSNNVKTIYFPIAFPNSCFNAFPTYQYNSAALYGQYTYITNISKNSFTLAQQYSTVSHRWIAIGT